MLCKLRNYLLEFVNIILLAGMFTIAISAVRHGSEWYKAWRRNKIMLDNAAQLLTHYGFSVSEGRRIARQLRDADTDDCVF